MTARVSRRDLAHNRLVWMATGATGLMIAVLTIALAAFEDSDRAWAQIMFAGAYGLFALSLLRRQPPEIGDPFNHVVLVYAYSATITGFAVFQPGGGMAISAGMFVGPLIAVRLQDRRLIGLHLLAATGGLVTLAVGGAVTGLIDPTSVIGIAIMIPAMWVLCAACAVVLEASEQQGEELERLVRRDPLTGVGNRRLLDERLAHQLARHSRNGQQLSLLALDLNGFKALNDTLGHEAGDELLRDTAAALVRAARPQDTVVRQGGDEFCVILPQTSPAHAQRTANAIRANLAGTDTGGLVTTGIGIATYPDDALEEHVLLHVADERLIDDKAGRARRNAERASASPLAEPTGLLAKDPTASETVSPD
ncbi:MAG: diguanylate cyclase [Solirubrobacteraceae bacterium]|nr:diguanylate cyclase [Solirubrobacteraceae bacterium]